jgi:CAAX protease family protein
VNAPNESSPVPNPRERVLAVDPWTQLPQSQRPVLIDPDNPPWGMVAGTLTWVGSVLLTLLIPAIALIAYIQSKGLNLQEAGNSLLQDKTAVLVVILSTIPVHLLTLFIVWAVVTNFGKRPFWKSLGWSWSKKFGVWKTIGLAVLLLVVGLTIVNLIKGGETDIDQIANSSLASRYTLAILAGVTGPFVEELVYRGVLYSALQKTIGVAWAVSIVSFLFALVHVWQYRNNVGVILAVSMLSLSLTLLRAYSGRLLPCFIVHLVFNGIQSIYIVLEPYFSKSVPQIEQKAPAIAMLWRTFRPLLF